MDKNRISNNNWVCRTLTGTIALEESPMPLKQRNFLKQLSKPVRVSELYKILKEKYPNDYSRTSDFVEIVNFTNKKIWIEKVEQPQLIDSSDGKKDDNEITPEDSRDSSFLPEELLNLSRKVQSGYSEEGSIFAVEFEDSKEKEDIKKWFDEEDDYEEPQVEFIHDEKTKDLILKLGLGSIDLSNIDEFDLPEENPFINKGSSTNKTEAAEQVLQFLNNFDDESFLNSSTESTNNEIDSKSSNSNNNSLEQEANINNIFNQEKEVFSEPEDIVQKDNNKDVSLEERENKRQERLNKRTTIPSSNKKVNKKEQGIFGSLKNSIKKIIGR